jgi:MFS-type transporter involved in bile tolerance (Atg22 family)
MHFPVSKFLLYILYLDVLVGPTHKNKAFIFGISWGISLGWLHPQHITAFTSIIPSGQDAELMGVFLLCAQILGWLPPLVFTLLNEMGYSMAYGLGSLVLFFVLGIVCLLMVGNLNPASVSEEHTTPPTKRNLPPQTQYQQLPLSNHAQHSSLPANSIEMKPLPIGEIS